MDDLVTQAQSLSEKYSVHGLAFQGGRYEGMFCDYLEFVTGYGGRISVKPGDIEINTPQNVEALKSMVDLIHTHKVTPPGVANPPWLLRIASSTPAARHKNPTVRGTEEKDASSATTT